MKNYYMFGLAYLSYINFSTNYYDWFYRWTLQI